MHGLGCPGAFHVRFGGPGGHGEALIKATSTTTAKRWVRPAGATTMTGTSLPPAWATPTPCYNVLCRPSHVPVMHLIRRRRRLLSVRRAQVPSGAPAQGPCRYLLLLLFLHTRILMSSGTDD